MGPSETSRNEELVTGITRLLSSHIFTKQLISCAVSASTPNQFILPLQSLQTSFVIK